MKDQNSIAKMLSHPSTRLLLISVNFSADDRRYRALSEIFCAKTRRSESDENGPPNYPPRSVFLVLKLNFLTKIFRL